MSAAAPHAEAIRTILGGYVSRVTAQSVLRAALHRAKLSDTSLERDGVSELLIKELQRGLDFFLEDEGRRRECMGKIQALLPASGARAAFAAAQAIATAARSSDAARALAHDSARFAVAGIATAAAPGDSSRPIEVNIVDENGIVDARTRARALAASIGFSSTDQYKLATAVSELSRNIFRYAGTGKISFGTLISPRPGMFIIARDEGPGIADIDHVLSEQYRSKTGLGRGLQGCRRIMDHFHVDSAPGRGTTVTLRKFVAC